MNWKIKIFTLFFMLPAYALAQKIDINYNDLSLKFQIQSPQEKTVSLTEGKSKGYLCRIPATVEYNGTEYIVESIAEKAFYKNKKITELYIPSSIKDIGKEAFAKCSELKKATFSEGLEKIQESAFAECPIEEVILPNTLKYIGEKAFFYHDAFLSAVRILYPVSNAFIPNTKIKTLSIPQSVKNIGDHAFNVFRNGVGVWTTSKSEILSLPDWITPEIAKDIGIHEDSYKKYIAQRNTKGFTDGHIAQTDISKNHQSTTQNHKEESLPKRNITDKVQALSDIDTNIPKNNTGNSKTFAIIISNEHYQEVTNVQFAINDGRAFKQYCILTLGLPEENIHIRENATLNNIIAEINWIKKICAAFKGEAKILFYYAGHGIPDENSKDAYLLPVDGLGEDPSTGYKLSELYATFGKMDAKSITIFLDACFSGSQRGDGMLVSARGVAIKARKEIPSGNMIVFSAAQGDETAYPFNEKGHGLFTYYLLKKLQETKGNSTYEELSKYITENVSRRSIIVNNKSQTPSIATSAVLKDSWKNLKLR